MTQSGKYEPMTQSDTSCADGRSRSERVELEMERQRLIWRPGVGNEVLKRAAINALISRGEY